MTDEMSGTGQPSPRQPLTRRELRERERAAAAKAEAERQQRENGEHIALPPAIPAVNTVDASTQQHTPDSSGASPVENELRRRRGRRAAAPETYTQPVRYSADQNRQLDEDLEPLPSDQRQYPGQGADEIPAGSRRARRAAAAAAASSDEDATGVLDSVDAGTGDPATSVLDMHDHTYDEADEDPEDSVHWVEDLVTADFDNDDDSDSHNQGYMAATAPSGQSLDDDEDQAERAARRAKATRKRNVIMLASFVVFVIALVGVGLGIRSLFPDPVDDFAGPGGEEVIFTVEPGAGPIVIGNQLTEAGIVASSDLFLDALEELPEAGAIQPGDYQLRYEMPAADAAAALLRIDSQGVNYIAVNPGMAIDDVFEQIVAGSNITEDEIRAAAEDPTVYGLPAEAPSLEGYIAVGEYRPDVDADAESVLRQLTQPTFTALEELGVTDTQEQYDTVTVASILVAEARPDDYETVAGAIKNRLDPSNPETAGYLQVDATVSYGLEDHRGLGFSEEEIRNEDNPYDTYAHQGLPPGPIGAPSVAAIEAAVNPPDHDYLYWVTTNIETGETKFSSTLSQHNEYVAEYRQYCADNPEVCGATSASPSPSS